MLKSNGPHRSKNPPVKFGFSLKTVPANIAKKLPPQVPSQTISHHDFQFLAQTPHVCFRRRKRVHNSASLKESHTRAHTAKQGPSGRGRYHYPRHVLHVHEHPRAGCQNGVLCRFWVLAGCAPEERRKPSGQRCAYACRCPEASRPRWAAWSFFVSDEITACTPYSRNFFQFSRRSSLCCSCASCFSTRSFSARSCSRVFSFVILLDPFS